MDRKSLTDTYQDYGGADGTHSDQNPLCNALLSCQMTRDGGCHDPLVG